MPKERKGSTEGVSRAEIPLAPYTPHVFDSEPNSIFQMQSHLTSVAVVL